MNMQSTSLQAYKEVVNPELTTRQLAVYRVILNRGPICIEDVSKIMTYEEHREVYPNHVSGRFSELERSGMIVDTLQRKRTGSTSHILWRITTDRERKEILRKQGQGQIDLF
jgi:hypothetical protein